LNQGSRISWRDDPYLVHHRLKRQTVADECLFELSGCGLAIHLIPLSAVIPANSLPSRIRPMVLFPALKAALKRIGKRIAAVMEPTG
jgi:hypothetical protein